MDKLRILVADDSQFMRTAYKRILDTQDNFQVVAMAADGEEALQKAIELAPDVAVLDVRMPNMDGIEAAHRILSHHPNTAIVIISAYDDLSFVTELIRGGPEGKAYLLKNSLDDIGELIRVVEAVVEGQTVLDPAIVQKLARLHVRRSMGLPAKLTQMEQNVLELIAEGYDNSHIARTLHLDQETVESHTTSIYQKLGLSEGENHDPRAQAVLAFVNQSTSVRYIMESDATS